MQFAEQLLGRGALSPKALDESSVDVGLQDPTVKRGSELPQDIPWVGTQAVSKGLSHTVKRVVPICHLAQNLLISAPAFSVSKYQRDGFLAGGQALKISHPNLFHPTHYPKDNHREPGYSSLIILCARRTSASFGESIIKLTSSV